MSLNKLQNNFSAHIFNHKKTAIVKNLPYSNKEALARLNIYRNNVFGNFSSVLAAIFPVVKKVVGKKKFEQLIKEYQNKHHSRSGNLDHYGDFFPKFLKNKSPAFLSDLSRLELDYHNSYFAIDVKDFAIEKFKRLSPEKYFNLKFELHPSCILFESKFPIFTIWQSDGKKIPANKKNEFILIDRANQACNVNTLSIEEFTFLQNLSQQKTLYQAYQKVSKISKKEFDVGKVLNKFINNRVIADFF